MLIKQKLVSSQAIKIVLSVFFVVLMTGCRLHQNGPEVNVDELEWMTGTWRHTNDTLLENIIMQQDYIECVIYHIEDGQAIVRERRRIFNDHDQLRMTTTVFFKEENEFSNYRLKAQKGNKLIFENLDPHYAECITFEKITQTSMLVIFDESKNGLLRRVELIMDNEP